MKRYWLLFSQTTTVFLALWFAAATLAPQWLQRTPAPPPSGVTLLQAVNEPLAAARHTGSLRDAARSAAPAVVSINTSQRKRPRQADANPWFRFFNGDAAPNDSAPTGLGSGVIVSAQGHVWTNHHVIEAADDIEVVLADGRKTAAKIIGVDPETDLALLQIDLPNLPVIVLGPPDAAHVGDVVLAIGNPFGVGQTVTSGIVSALGRKELGINTFENFIQTDAAINPGNSGGALVDANGHLMGINTAIYSRSGGNMGIGFAIPVSTAQHVMRELLRAGHVTRGWIGVGPQELTPDLAKQLGLPQANAGQTISGVLMANVLRDGPAAKAGVRAGDVVTHINQQAVGQVSQLLTLVAALPPGQSAVLQLRRGAATLELTLTPGSRPVPAKR